MITPHKRVQFLQVVDEYIITKSLLQPESGTTSQPVFEGRDGRTRSEHVRDVIQRNRSLKSHET